MIKVHLLMDLLIHENFIYLEILQSVIVNSGVFIENVDNSLDI